jgi:hypothetical protein
VIPIVALLAGVALGVTLTVAVADAIRVRRRRLARDRITARRAHEASAAGPVRALRGR